MSKRGKRKRKRNHIRRRDIDELSELMKTNWHRERRSGQPSFPGYDFIDELWRDNVPRPIEYIEPWTSTLMSERARSKRRIQPVVSFMPTRQRVTPEEEVIIEMPIGRPGFINYAPTPEEYLSQYLSDQDRRIRKRYGEYFCNYVGCTTGPWKSPHDAENHYITVHESQAFPDTIPPDLLYQEEMRLKRILEDEVATVGYDSEETEADTLVDEVEVATVGYDSEETEADTLVDTDEELPPPQLILPGAIRPPSPVYIANSPISIHPLSPVSIPTPPSPVSVVSYASSGYAPSSASSVVTELTEEPPPVVVVTRRISPRHSTRRTSPRRSIASSSTVPPPTLPPVETIPPSSVVKIFTKRGNKYYCVHCNTRPEGWSRGGIYKHFDRKHKTKPVASLPPPPPAVKRFIKRGNKYYCVHCNIRPEGWSRSAIYTHFDREHGTEPRNRYYCPVEGCNFRPEGWIMKRGLELHHVNFHVKGIQKQSKYYTKRGKKYYCKFKGCTEGPWVHPNTATSHYVRRHDENREKGRGNRKLDYTKVKEGGKWKYYCKVEGCTEGPWAKSQSAKNHYARKHGKR